MRSIIERLTNMQSAFSRGELINHGSLGDELNVSKKYHEELQLSNRIELDKNRLIIEEASA